MESCSIIRMDLLTYEIIISLMLKLLCLSGPNYTTSPLTIGQMAQTRAKLGPPATRAGLDTGE